jgi:hypothetical protein
LLSLTLPPTLTRTLTLTLTLPLTLTLTLPLRPPLPPAPVTMLPMVRWASCPPCGRISESWWSMRGLEAHATKAGGVLGRDACGWRCR